MIIFVFNIGLSNYTLSNNQSYNTKRKKRSDKLDRKQPNCAIFVMSLAKKWVGPKAKPTYAVKRFVKITDTLGRVVQRDFFGDDVISNNNKNTENKNFWTFSNNENKCI